MKQPLIIRAYRIRKEQALALKKKARKEKKGEGEILREALDMAIGEYLPLQKIN